MSPNQPSGPLAADTDKLVTPIRQADVSTRQLYSPKDAASVKAAQDASTELGTPPTAAPAPVSSEPLEPNMRIGKYVVVRQIGRGGQGEVYLAEDHELGRQVALKTLSVLSRKSKDRVKRFQTEARAAARLHHANIVQVYEVFEHNGIPFISMEYVEGETLAAIIKRNSLSRRQLVRLLVATCEAVGEAHALGIIHRDLKPHNILITKGNVPKIMDFGLAKCLEEDSRFSTQTVDGMVVGTPAYMAPEQAEGLQELIGPGTDVYALGGIMYQCLTGWLPHEAETPNEMLHRTVNEDPEPPIKVDPTIDKDLDAICMKAMEKSPIDRYPTAGAMAVDLKRYLNNEPISARNTGLTDKFKKALRRNRDVAVVSAIALTFMAVTIATAVSLFAQQSTQRVTESLQGELKSIANTAALMFPASDIQQVKSREDESKPAFKEMVKKLNAVRGRNRNLRNAYLIGRAATQSGLAFLVDADAYLNGKSHHAGDAYLPADGSGAFDGFWGATAAPEPTHTEAGLILAGYAPVYDENGIGVAVIRVDIGAERLKADMRPTLRTTFQVSALAAVMFVGLTAFTGMRLMRQRKHPR